MAFSLYLDMEVKEAQRAVFYADLHIHSKFSRATSRDCDLEHLAEAAARKGLAVVGTGDFTHPGWWEEIQRKLVPAEGGLYRLRPELEKKALKNLPVAQPEPVRFLLQVEIATIYKKAGQTRKIHHLIYMPSMEQARQFSQHLVRLGNLASDGRPILGLDSRTLLELVLQTGEGCYLVPAHVWTPWFSVFGAHSGFDRLEDCYEDLSNEVFALETGLSSDPPMNWRWSALDRFTLVSNSDAHSPAKLGRECCVFECSLDYFAIQQALRTGQGYAGTVEFFPEEGKYHLDGHRQCGVCWEPAQTQRHGGRCAQCGKPVTLGVLHRVSLLADRPSPPEPLPERAAPFRSLIPLCEILGEILQVGPQTKSVLARYEELLARLGPELWILEHAPLEEIARCGGQLLAEAIHRMRSGQVIRQAGFDGQYGIIRLFTEEELQNRQTSQTLFAKGEIPARSSTVLSPKRKGEIARHAALWSPNPPLAGQESFASEASQPRGIPAKEQTLCIAPSPYCSGAEAGEKDSSPAGLPAQEGLSPRGEKLKAPLAKLAEAKPPSPIEKGEKKGHDLWTPAFAGSPPVFSAVDRETADRLLADLDPQQRAAVQCVEGPMLILAGPGTGKTRTLTHRIAYLVAHHGIAPTNCLAITFSRRAAAEMRSRLQQLLPDLAEQIPVMTFHGFGWHLLREYRRGLLKRKDRPAAMEGGLEAQDAQNISALGDALVSPSPTASLHERECVGKSSGQRRGKMEETFRQGKGQMGESHGEAEGEMKREFSPAVRFWEKLHGEGGCLFIASEAQRRELLENALNISSSEADRILKRISLAKRAGSPDPEHSKLQKALQVYQAEMSRRGWLDFDDLVLLPVEIFRADSAWRTHCQRRFRYVSVDEFQDIDAAQYALLRALVPPEGNICVIGDPDQSIYAFRGAHPGFFQQFLADYPTARRFLLTKNYRSSRVIVEAASQMIAQATLVPDRRLEAEPGRGPHVEIHTCPTEQAEAELVVHRIEQLLGGPTFFSLDTARSTGQTQAELSFSDIAVLYRTEAQAHVLIEAFRRSGMPFQVCSHRSITELAGVQRVQEELLRQPNLPSVALTERVRKLLDFLPPAPPARNLKHPEASASEAVELEISPALRELIVRLAEKSSNDLPAFLAELAMSTEADLWDSRAERISLLTLHAAKGLEFPVVFIVGCEDGVIPLRFSAEEEEARLAEERRLLFVGMTRAKEYLILTHARRRFWQGKLRPMKPSPFLAHLQKELLAFHAHRPQARRQPKADQLPLFE